MILAFTGSTLTATWALVTHTEFGLPLELFEFQGSLKGRMDSLELLQFVIQKARSLGSRELFYTVSADSTGTETISNAGFRSWRNTVRFKSTKPGDIEMRGYRSCATNTFDRSEIIALLEQTSELSADSQIQLYRERLGGVKDAETTLKVMEYTEYDPNWWRVALSPDEQLIGIVLPVLVYGEPTIGFIGVRPECRELPRGSSGGSLRRRRALACASGLRRRRPASAHPRPQPVLLAGRRGDGASSDRAL